VQNGNTTRIIVAWEAVADMRANDESVPEPISHRRYSGKLMGRASPEELAHVIEGLNKIIA
jgi:hypothetical protein